MSGERRSSLLFLVLILAVPALGENFPASATVVDTTRAEITNFSVVTGSPVDFLFTVGNVGNTNISVFPEITVYDSNNNTAVQLIYDTGVYMPAGSVEDMKLSWNESSYGSFTANLVVFYDNYSRSSTASQTFVLYPQATAASRGGHSHTTVTSTPTPASAVTATPATTPPAPKQQPPAAATSATASTGTGIASNEGGGGLYNLISGLFRFALPEGAGRARIPIIMVPMLGISFLILKWKKIL